MTPKIFSQEIETLISVLLTRLSLLSSKKVTAGFDGFVDTIAKAIKVRHENKTPEYFQTIEEFGKYTLEKKNGSFSIEVEEQSVKIGGNMPILANTLGSLGIEVNCVGALGFPKTNKIFDSLPSTCKKYSFAEPGASTAYEFNDGKMMLGSMGELNSLGWNCVKDRIGIETLKKLYSESDLLCLVNWSEIEASGNIWRGMLEEVVKKTAKPNRHKLTFFDLSDCSKRSDESIREILTLISEYARYADVSLGLNKNETSKLHRVLFGNDAEDLKHAGENIFGYMKINTLLLHHSREAIGIDSNGIFRKTSFFVERPKLSTGAGDNFNAGYNVGRLLGLDLADCLTFAHAVSAFYITNGESAQLKDVINFLDHKK